MAAISDPFHQLHVLVGFSLLKPLMLRAGLGHEAARAVTPGVVGLLAAGPHAGAERPFLRLAGRRRIRGGMAGVAAGPEVIETT